MKGFDVEKEEGRAGTMLFSSPGARLRKKSG
jgi:hypothetical protein